MLAVFSLPGVWLVGCWIVLWFVGAGWVGAGGGCRLLADLHTFLTCLVLRFLLSWLWNTLFSNKARFPLCISTPVVPLLQGVGGVGFWQRSACQRGRSGGIVERFLGWLAAWVARLGGTIGGTAFLFGIFLGTKSDVFS